MAKRPCDEFAARPWSPKCTLYKTGEVHCWADGVGVIHEKKMFNVCFGNIAGWFLHWKQGAVQVIRPANGRACPNIQNLTGFVEQWWK